MKLGIVFPQTEIADDPAVVRAWAEAVEAAGFDYILVFDHVLGVDPLARPDWDPFGVLRGNASRLASGSGAAAADAPVKRAPYDFESAFQEPLALFAFLAGTTSRIELATGVIILPQRQTALVAKQAATVANLSNGRLRLGVGIGWNDAEYEALGINFKTRGRRVDEQIGLLRRLWDEETVAFAGEFDQVRGAGINPRPKQRIPIWVGGNSGVAMRRAARLADGWMPAIGVRKAGETVAQFRGLVEAAGRDPDEVGLENVIQCGTTVGTPLLSTEQAAEMAGRCSEAGFTHCCITTMDAGHRSIDEHLEFAVAWRRMLG